MKFGWLVFFLIFQNCFAGASFAFRKVPFGSLYTETKTNEFVTENEVSSAKAGEACAYSYLGWVVVGDASVDKAMENAKITKIALVDQKYKNILQFYAEYCVVVKGQ